MNKFIKLADELWGNNPKVGRYFTCIQSWCRCQYKTPHLIAKVSGNTIWALQFNGITIELDWDDDTYQIVD